MPVSGPVLWWPAASSPSWEQRVHGDECGVCELWLSLGAGVVALCGFLRAPTSNHCGTLGAGGLCGGGGFVWCCHCLLQVMVYLPGMAERP